MLQEVQTADHGSKTATSLVDQLLAAFQRSNVAYCHWKSNRHLAEAMAGELDLDLLIDRSSLSNAAAGLARLGFKAAKVRWGKDTPGVCHYYGFDPHAEHLVHVHSFSRVLTGESYVKSHLLPLDRMLLQNAYVWRGLRVTARPAELVLFTIRTFIKYGSLADLISLGRKSSALREELDWLRDGIDIREALDLLDEHCPVVDKTLFLQCIEAISRNRSLLARLILAQRMRLSLSVFARHTSAQRLMAYAELMWAEVRRRWPAKRKNRVLHAGGALIAVVGADATGKSTVVREIGRWLGAVFTISAVHTGKPPSAALTAPFNLALAIARRLMSPFSGRQRAAASVHSPSAIPTTHTFKGVPSLLFALRATALAWDRRRLILRARRRVAEGELVLCDRYPSPVTGAMDSPRLIADASGRGIVSRIYNWLVRIEQTLYAQMPAPDIVLRLSVSLETAKKRDRARNGRDGEAYLERRHQPAVAWHMPEVGYLFDIDTEHSLEKTLREAKTAIWAVL